MSRSGITDSPSPWRKLGATPFIGPSVVEPCPFRRFPCYDAGRQGEQNDHQNKKCFHGSGYPQLCARPIDSTFATPQPAPLPPCRTTSLPWSGRSWSDHTTSPWDVIDAIALSVDVAIDTALARRIVVGCESLAPAPLPRLHELAARDAARCRLGADFLVNVVERVAAIRILGAKVAGCGVTDFGCWMVGL